MFSNHPTNCSQRSVEIQQLITNQLDDKIIEIPLNSTVRINCDTFKQITIQHSVPVN